MYSRTNIADGISVPQDNQSQEFQFMGPWIPATPLKPFPTRSNEIPGETYSYQVGGLNYQECNGFTNGYTDLVSNDRAAQNLNAPGILTNNNEEYLLRANAGLAGRNGLISSTVGTWNTNQTGNLLAENSNLITAPAVQRYNVEEVSVMNNPLMQPVHSEAGNWGEFDFDDLLFGNNAQCSLLSLLNSDAHTQNGFPASQRPDDNIYMQQGLESDGFTCTTGSAHFVPPTPSQTIRTENAQILETLRSSTSDSLVQGKKHAEDIVKTAENNTLQQNINGILQKIVDSSVVDSPAEKDLYDGTKQNDKEIDLNNTPQQKPKRKKYMPKVVKERKPKQKTSKLAPPTTTEPEEKTGGKRKQNSSMSVNESTIQELDGITKRDGSSLEIPGKTCRRSLNFDLEKTRDGTQVEVEQQQRAYGPTFVSSTRDLNGANIGYRDSVALASLGQQERQHFEGLQPGKQAEKTQNLQPSFLTGNEYCKQTGLPIKKRQSNITERNQTTGINGGNRQAERPAVCQQPGLPIGDQQSRSPIGNQKYQQTGLPIGNWEYGTFARNQRPILPKENLQTFQTCLPLEREKNQVPGSLINEQQFGLPIQNPQLGFLIGNQPAQTISGYISHTSQEIAGNTSGPERRIEKSSLPPGTNSHAAILNQQARNINTIIQQTSIKNGHNSLQKDILERNGYISAGSNGEAVDMSRKLMFPSTPHSARTILPKPLATKGSKKDSYPAVGQMHTCNAGAQVHSSLFQQLSKMREPEGNRQHMNAAFSKANKRMKVQSGLYAYMHSKDYEVIEIEDHPDVSLAKGSKNDIANGLASKTNSLPIQSSDNKVTHIFVPPTPPRVGTVMENQLVVYDATATETGTKKSPSSRKRRNENQNKSLKESGLLAEPLYPYFVNEITNRMEKLNLDCNTIQMEQNTIVLYQGDTAVVPYEIKKRKPRPKVDLDEETNRIWNLLLGQGGSENYEEVDAEKEKRWEEERRIFRGRADSFIARMHLVQGDRRFSPWKGSVVDSVIGVFLTQNVSDHLSSSAFMSLASRYPPSSKCNIVDDSNTSCTLENTEACIFNLNDVPARETIPRHPPDTQVFGIDIASTEQIKESPNSRIERVIFVDSSTQNLGEEGLSSQDSFDPSGSSSDAEFSATKCEPITSHESAKTPRNGKIALLDESAYNGNSNPQGHSGCNSGYVEKTCKAQQKPSTDRNSSNDSTTLTRPINDDYGEVEEVVHQCSSTLQQIISQPQVFDMDNSGRLKEGNFCSWLSIASAAGNGNQQTDLQSSARQAQNVAHHCTDQIEPRNHEAYAFSGKHQMHQGSSSPMHGSPLQHNLLYNRPDELSKSFQPHCTLRELLNTAEECSTRQCSDSSTIQNNLYAPKFKERISDVEQMNTINKNGSMDNKLVQSNSSNQARSAVDNGESNSTIIRTTKKKPGDENEAVIDWDNLRKETRYDKTKQERSKDNEDSIDYEAIRRAKVSEISEAIKERGMNNKLADRMKAFLDRLVRDHGSIDLEWLRDVPPDKAKEYLLSIRGLGLKSVECVRLLTLHNLAFPVDTNVGRIAVRLGWVPLQPLPESLQLHLLELYPVLESIQKYLWPRLCKLDQRTLYELHYQLITFGKVFCTKSKPNCNACPMRGECRHFASAFASARLALPGPEEKSLASGTVSIKPETKPATVIPPMQLPPPEKNFIGEVSNVANCQPNVVNCQPIIEEPATPEQECTQITESDIEDAYYEDPDEIPMIKLNLEEFSANLQQYMEKNMELQEGDMSKALVALDPTAASLPTPKLKNVSRLRTEHQVYELPDSHPLLQGMDTREPDDPSPYLLAIWTPGETSGSTQPPDGKCELQNSGGLCNDETCYSCNNKRETNSQTVRGTLLIPCRTAMRGSFPLNGTYFQVNEVFADNESSVNPIDVPRNWIWNLPRRTVYFGTSVTSIFKGLTTEQIQYCFWRGFVCVRGFEQKTRAPRPLMARLHFPASKMKAKNENLKSESNKKHSAVPTTHTTI